MNKTSTPSSAQAVLRERVTFSSQGETLVGTLFLPASQPGQAPLPAAVVTGAWMTVKEQMPQRYAFELSQRGVAALAFDFRGWGESAGSRRQLENPENKIADILAAFRCLASRPDLDAARLGGLGLCASAGYMAAAAVANSGMRSLALVAPWLQDAAIVEEVYGGKEGVAALLEVGRAAEAEFLRTGRQQFIPAASTTDRSALMFGAPYYTEAGRGLIPEWRNEVDPAFWGLWLGFDGLRYAPGLQVPLQVVHSNAAAIPQGARRFLETVHSPKNELWLEGVSQFDFYDAPAAVAAASDAVAQHFLGTL